MYEKPTLTEIGKTEDAVLGIASIGADFDGLLVVAGFEFIPDAEPC
jgi:hypothetical protein